MSVLGVVLGFGPVEQLVIPWTVSQTAAEVQRLLGSFSSWMVLVRDVSDRPGLASLRARVLTT